MKVWVVTIPDNEILGVFATKELAEQAIASSSSIWIEWGEVEPQEFTVEEIPRR